jgi:endonuclease III
MLSSQTKDQITHAAVKKLREHGLTPENIVKTDLQTLETLIYPASFYRVASIFCFTIFLLSSILFLF